MFMLQNDFEYSAGQFGPELLGGHKSLVYKTDLNRATTDVETQNAVRSLADWFAEDFQDVVTTALERLYSIPRGSADSRH